mgnify:CR=1 FL=1
MDSVESSGFSYISETATTPRLGDLAMPEEVFFALFSLGFLGVSDFLYKWGQRFELRGASFMLLQNIAYIPTAIALAVYRQELDFSVGLGYGFLNGMLAFVAFLLLLKSLKHGDALALVPVVRLNFAVTAALTVSFLGEQLNWVKGAALGLAALAILANGAGYASVARQRNPFFMALIAETLSPIRLIVSALGPMKIKPLFSTASAKSAFSARKP